MLPVVCGQKNEDNFGGNCSNSAGRCGITCLLYSGWEVISCAGVTALPDQDPVPLQSAGARRRGPGLLYLITGMQVCRIQLRRQRAMYACQLLTATLAVKFSNATDTDRTAHGCEKKKDFERRHLGDHAAHTLVDILQEAGSGPPYKKLLQSAREFTTCALC